MFDGQTESVAPAATTFVLAYQRLLEDLERALWEDGAGNVTAAYEEYTGAYAEALSDPLVYQRVSSALQGLAEALARVLERADARGLVDEAVSRYLEDVGAAWPELRAGPQDLESLLAVATGMTTIAWLRGAGSSGLVGPFGSSDLLGGATPATSFGAGGDGAWGEPGDAAANGFGLGSGFGAGSADAGEAAAEPWAAQVDDDGIVWQELSVGEDGQIVQRPASSAGRPQPGRGGDPGDGRAAAPRADLPPGPSQAGDQADPVELLARAYASYVEGLRAAGVPVGGAHADDPPPAAPLAGAAARSDLEQRSAELASAYLRLTQGVGSVPDLFLSYARFLGSASDLVERELALVRAYERLLASSTQGGGPARLRQTADAQYRRFLAALREAWTHVDPATTPPARLAELAELASRAAALNEQATTGRLRPT